MIMKVHGYLCVNDDGLGDVGISSEFDAWIGRLDE